jgi:DNA-binding NarL/FixJ family response regulator
MIESGNLMKPRTQPKAKSGKTDPATARKKIFIVEDHPTFCEGLVQILSGEKDLCVCGTADDADRSFRAITRLKPDLVLVDITLPGKSGLELIKQLRTQKIKVKILVVSMHDEALYADRVLRAGGDGYIMKQEDPEEIVHAIRDVLNGHIYVSEEVLAGSTNISAQRASTSESHPLDQLSDLELNILELLGCGKTNREIARHLELEVKQVTEHCTRMRRKLKLKSDNALVCFAVVWREENVS